MFKWKTKMWSFSSLLLDVNLCNWSFHNENCMWSGDNEAGKRYVNYPHSGTNITLTSLVLHFILTFCCLLVIFSFCSSPTFWQHWPSVCSCSIKKLITSLICPYLSVSCCYKSANFSMILYVSVCRLIWRYWLTKKMIMCQSKTAQQQGYDLKNHATQISLWHT